MTSPHNILAGEKVEIGLMVYYYGMLIVRDNTNWKRMAGVYRIEGLVKCA